MATFGQVAFIIAQHDADSRTALSARSVDGSSVVLLAQEPNESLGGLGQRVRAKVQSLVSEGWKIRSATFVAKNGFDLMDVPATMELLRSLVFTMVVAGQGTVYLQAPNNNRRAHYALEALASAISDQVRSTGVEIVTTPRTRMIADEVAAAGV